MSEPLEVWMVFHVIAASEEAANDSLQDHIEKLEEEDSVLSMDAEIEEAEVVDQPHPDIEKGYSTVCEVDLEVASFSDLVGLVINYGPTSVDVKAPETVEMGIGEVREALNEVAQIMHQFLQAGAGGMMISRSTE